MYITVYLCLNMVNMPWSLHNQYSAACCILIVLTDKRRSFTLSGVPALASSAPELIRVIGPRDFPPSTFGFLGLLIAI